MAVPGGLRRGLPPLAPLDRGGESWLLEAGVAGAAAGETGLRDGERLGDAASSGLSVLADVDVVAKTACLSWVGVVAGERDAVRVGVRSPPRFSSPSSSASWTSDDVLTGAGLGAASFGLGGAAS